MADSAPGSSIRNNVAFEAYADIAIIDQADARGATALIAGQLMQALHGAIVDGLALAVAFPQAVAGSERTIGPLIRVFGALDDVAAFVDSPVVKGLGMARFLSLEGPLPVPNGVSEGMAYTRARPDKFLPSTWDRLDRRARARRKSGVGLMDEDDIARRREVLQERGREMQALPSFSLASASTSRRYAIYVGVSSRAPSGAEFNSFGLSDGRGAVPAF